MASACARVQNVRETLVDLQRQLAAKDNVVMDGRDIGTHVLPDADLKIYLTASCQTRALRRFNELREKGVLCSLQDVEEDIRKRDRQDMGERDFTASHGGGCGIARQFRSYGGRGVGKNEIACEDTV